MGNTTKTFTLLFMLVNLEIANAEACEKSIKPEDYLVCSGSDVTYYGSDFQGPACAVGNVNVTQFALDSRYSNNCQSWSVGGNYKQGTGSANGNITVGGNVSLDAVNVNGQLQHGGNLSLSVSKVREGLKKIDGVATKSAIENTWKFFEDQSKSMADAKVALKPMIGNNTLTFYSQGQFQTFQIDAKELKRASVIRLNGICTTPFIINIRGEDATISETDIQISKTLQGCMGNIFFNFPDAKSVTLKKSGDSKNGVPATILAPQANLNFTDDLVTGGVFAKKITGNGQVNYTKIAWPKSGTNQMSGALPESSSAVSK